MNPWHKSGAPAVTSSAAPLTTDREDTPTMADRTVPLQRMTAKGLTCSVPGCSKPMRSKGLCNVHRMRLRTTGRLDDPKRREISEFWNFVDQSAGENACWPWTAGRNKAGYGKFNCSSVRYTAHRVAWKLTHGVLDEEICVLHQCDNPPCCNPTHLFLGTRADNAADRDTKGRTNPPRGERKGAAKLTEDAVGDLRNRRANGESFSSLAKRFGVSEQTAWTVATRRAWTHVA